MIAYCINLRRLGVPLSYPLAHLLTASVVPRLEVLAVELHRDELFYRPSSAVLSLSWPLPLSHAAASPLPSGGTATPATIVAGASIPSIAASSLPANIPPTIVYLLHDRADIYCRLVPITRAAICGGECVMTVVDMKHDTPVAQLIAQRHIIIVMAGFLEYTHRYHTCGCQPTYIPWPAGVGLYGSNVKNDGDGGGDGGDGDGHSDDNSDGSDHGGHDDHKRQGRPSHRQRQLLSVTQHMTWMRDTD